MSERLDGLRVMVVEDEPLQAIHYQELLDVAGAVVIGPFASASAAKAELEETAIDVVIVDFALEGETTASLQSELAERNVPFVVVTAYPKVLVRQYERQVILSKPVPAHLLCRVVRLAANWNTDAEKNAWRG